MSNINSNPLVTVLMPVYNGERYLNSAIDSILNQTYNNLEFLIINDGSTDRSVEIINEYKDSRIRYIKNETNINLAKSLNKGVKLSNAKFIARMDCDDISHPDRLKKQVGYMLKHPDTALLGSGFTKINKHGRKLYRIEMPFISLVIRWKMLFFNCFAHPTIMLNKDKLIQHKLNYGVSPDDDHFKNIDIKGVGDEDYLLFAILSNLEETNNLKESLLYYREHEGQLTNINKSFLFNQKDIIVQNILIKMFNDSEEEININLLNRFIRQELNNEESNIILNRIYKCFIAVNKLNTIEDTIVSRDKLLRSKCGPLEHKHIIHRLCRIIRWGNLNRFRQPQEIKLLRNYIINR
jgi:glycosyltransferase involved in cell wall biosynthesis